MALSYGAVDGKQLAGGSGKIPFASTTPGAEEPRANSALLSEGRDALAPIKGAAKEYGVVLRLIRRLGLRFLAEDGVRRDYYRQHRPLSPDAWIRAKRVEPLEVLR